MAEIKVADNTTVPILGQENLVRHSGGHKFALSNVQLCPDIAQPLLSDGQIALEGY